MFENRPFSHSSRTYKLNLAQKTKNKGIKNTRLSYWGEYKKYDIYEPLNRTSSRIILAAEASGLAQKFRIVLPASQK